MRYGSSPNVSSTRPQRRSRAMQSTGENVHLKPVLVASTAVIRAIRRAFSGLQLHATASCVPKMVAPGQKECPWMQSSASSRGMPSRVAAASSMAWPIRSGGTWSNEPTFCRVTRSSRSPWASSCMHWPTFSASVIRASRSATRTTVGRPLSWYESITSPLTRSNDNETVTPRPCARSWCYCLVSNCTTTPASTERFHGNRKGPTPGQTNGGSNVGFSLLHPVSPDAVQARWRGGWWRGSRSLLQQVAYWHDQRLSGHPARYRQQRSGRQGPHRRQRRHPVRRGLPVGSPDHVQPVLADSCLAGQQQRHADPVRVAAALEHPDR